MQLHHGRNKMIENIRYIRQLLIDEITPEVQQRIEKSKVLIVGTGGLGSAVAFYLAVAGVGYLRLCDYDVIELSNLNRQILHNEERLGQSKVESAQRTLTRLNPQITVDPRHEKITSVNIETIIKDIDVIVDCLDNYEARCILNQSACKASIPFVYGSMNGLEGQLSFLSPPQTPCFQCIFQKSTTTGPVPALGATAGVIGSMQAMQVLKYLGRFGELAKNKLLVYDGINDSLRGVQISKNTSCPICSASQ